jgi:hypothetical protein
MITPRGPPVGHFYPAVCPDGVAAAFAAPLLPPSPRRAPPPVWVHIHP